MTVSLTGRRSGPVAPQPPADTRMLKAFLKTYDNGEGFLTQADDFEIERAEANSAGGSGRMALDYQALSAADRRSVRKAFSGEVRVELETYRAKHLNSAAVKELLQTFGEACGKGAGTTFFLPHLQDPNQVRLATGAAAGASAFAEALARVAVLGSEELVAMGELMSPTLLQGEVGRVLAADARLQALFNPLDIAGCCFTSAEEQKKAEAARTTLRTTLGLRLEVMDNGLTVQHLGEAGLLKLALTDPRRDTVLALAYACVASPQGRLSLSGAAHVLAPKA